MAGECCVVRHLASQVFHAFCLGENQPMSKGDCFLTKDKYTGRMTHADHILCDARPSGAELRALLLLTRL